VCLQKVTRCLAACLRLKASVQSRGQQRWVVVAAGPSTALPAADTQLAETFDALVAAELTRQRQGTTHAGNAGLSPGASSGAAKHTQSR